MEDDDFNVENLSKQRAAKAEADRKAQEEALAKDPELAAIMAETKAVQKDTLVSTQNSVRTIKETIVVADSTSTTLHQQGEQLDHIERKAEDADANATDSYKSARELHKYKGLLPVSVKNIFTGGKKKKEDAELAKANKQYDKETARLELAQEASQPSLASAPKASTDYGGDETERKINENLDEMLVGVEHLQMRATEMNQELDRQNVTIKRIDATTSHTDYTIKSADRKIQEFL